MSPFALSHVLLGLVAVVTGFVIFGLRKGDPRHRRLGWVYAACMSLSLVCILVEGAARPVPFHGYAALILAGLAVAILATRLRFTAWRGWHGALMSFSMVAAMSAIGGVVGGVALGVGKGPAYYRMFDLVIAGVTAAGLWLIQTRPVVWGRSAGAKLWFGGIAAAATLLLLAANLLIS